MNKQTKKLFQKACSNFGHGKYFTQELLAEKFAELIVRECARVYWNIDDGELHEEYVKALKKHFGVK